MDFEYEDLFQWVETHNISRPKRNINRDFSDAIPLIEILKFHYPKLVEVHNYAPKNALSQKIVNWQTLNRRVLNKLKINLSNEQIENLSKSVPGEIERLLIRIKKKVELKATSMDDGSELNGSIDRELTSDSPSGVFAIRLKNGDTVSSQKVVPYEIYENLQRELTEKVEALQSFKNKSAHLEGVLETKQTIIKDLNRQLQQLMNEPSKERPAGMRIFKFF